MWLPRWTGRPGIGERVAPLLGPPPSSFEGLVTALINELAAQSGENEIVLVLDDYHLVDARQVHASVNEPFEPSVGRAASMLGEHPRTDRAPSRLSRPAPR